MDFDISLEPAELQRLLAASQLGVLASIGPDGSPHAVPIWPVLIGIDLFVETERISRKARNLRARPPFAFVVGLEPWGPSAVLLGRAVEVTHEDTRRSVREATAIRYYGTTAHPGFRTIERQYVDFGGSSVFRLDVERTISWDYRRLATEEWILPQPPPLPKAPPQQPDREARGREPDSES